MMTNGPGPLWPSMLPPEHQGRDDLCAVSARGVRVRYADGRELLCGTSGLWNVNLGYGNPVIAGAVADALRDASYLSVYQYENAYARARRRPWSSSAVRSTTAGSSSPPPAGRRTTWS